MGSLYRRNRRVKKLLEKPKEVIKPSHKCGEIYVFSPAIFEEIDQTPLSETGEYAITDTIQQMVEKENVYLLLNQDQCGWIRSIHGTSLLPIQ